MTHKDLDVWKQAMQFAQRIYVLTNDFPKTEQFGLVSQMRRAAVSVPSNIAEGAARQTNKEFIQFLYIALGSLMELETQLILSVEIGYLSKNDFEQLQEDLTAEARLLNGFIRYRKGRG